MLKILNGLLDADAGSFSLGAKVQIGYYDQEHHVLHAEKTIFEEISDTYPTLTETQIRNMLAAFLFTGDDVFKVISSLSGGERGRVSLAKLMLSEANFLILDEPTNHLDIASKEILEEALNSYTGTVLYVSHDRYFINQTATRILDLTNQSVVNYIGDYDYYLEKKEELTEKYAPSAQEATEETKEETSAETSTAKSPDNDLVVAMQADATHLDPHVSGNGVSNTVTNAMYESLVTFDADSNIVPMLAKEWTMSEDGKSYTFILNEGITFHDGEPFNAEAVIANWERGKADESLRVYSQTKSWVSAVADSEYQLTITLDEPNNTFLNKLTQVRIISPKAIKELGKDGLAKQSAGTGPYILSERVDGGYTKMVRNENYWREGPKVDTLTFKVVPEDGARIAMLQTGEADVINLFHQSR